MSPLVVGILVGLVCIIIAGAILGALLYAHRDGAHHDGNEGTDA